MSPYYAIKKLITLFLIIIVFGSCRTGPDIKWYISQPTKGGLARKNAILVYNDAQGYFCLNPIDTEFVINYCYNTEHGPIDNPPKFYFLDNASGGLIRKQVSETVLFKDTLNYSCMSPQDEAAFINWCFDIPGSMPIDDEIETDFANNRR